MLIFCCFCLFCFFFFQAEDGIRDWSVTGVQTCALPIFGFGAMTIDDGIAYGEPFQKAASALRFDGSGVRLDNMIVEKGAGTMTGAAFIGWDSTYSFNADGRRIPVERLAFLAYPRAPLSGIAEFTAGGSSTFDNPRNDFRFRVNDLFIGEEGVGQVTGTLALRGNELSGSIDAASPRLAVTGGGRIALTPRSDAELTFRFHDTSLDPYVRLFVPRLSPFTTAVVSGSIHVVGELADANRLLVDGTVDSLDLRLLDYAVKNAAPIRIALDEQQIRIQEIQLVGVDTRLRVSGAIGLKDDRIALEASGDANLGILQGFFRDVRGSGRAELTAAIDGPLQQPRFSGGATIRTARRRRRRRSRAGHSVEVRRAPPRAVHTARREQPGASSGQRRPHAARHLRSPRDRGARRHRAR